ncbi:uncharacterized protein LOC135368214 [Ornithodoros turicata]|uniref:uncharacterized protein LOC135368214 n=1 Tax=Ornithodoros turicata TaxID=34597 RepID=UPI0031391069
MVTCCVLGCKSRSGKSPNGITFHKFPNNPELKAAWVAAVKRRNWQPTAHSTVCSIHFREEDVDRTSLCCVRIRENRVPCLVSVLQMTSGPQKRNSSVLSENTEENKETPLDQLAKVATAALEAEPADCSEVKEIKSCTGRKQRAGTLSDTMPKGFSNASFDGGTLARFTSIQNMPVKFARVIILEPVKVGGPKVVAEQNRNIVAEKDVPENEKDTNSSENMHPESAADGCKAGDTCSKGKSVNTSQPSGGCSRVGVDCVNTNASCPASEMQPSGEKEAVVLPAPNVVCVISEVRGASGENVNDITPVNSMSGCAESGGRSSCEAFVCTAVPRAHLIDHSTMCRKPQGSEQTPRTTKGAASQKQPVGPVQTSPDCSDNPVQIMYCGTVGPTIQTAIPDHASYCGKPMPVLKTALAVPDHANYSRNVTAMAQATLPVALPNQPALDVPVTSAVVQHSPSPTSSQVQAALLTSPESSDASQNPVPVETPSPGPKNQPQVTRCLGESCVHEGIATMLKNELKRMGPLHLQRRKKVKVLQQALRRSKQKNEKLEKLVAELQKRPKLEDKEELHRKLGKVSVDLWTRQELKAKGEALPIEYSAELGTFAKTLYSHSAEAYEFVRQTFQGCLPHSRTLKKWKNSSRSNSQPSTTADSVVITNENGEQLVVPLVVVNEAPCIEGSDVVQLVNAAADVCT